MFGRGIVRILKKAVDSLSPRLGVSWRIMLDRRMLESAPVETPLGFRFVGHAAMQTGRFEPEETALISGLLSAADSFVNVGANIGYYCCIALSKGVRTFAFEPIETNLQYLARNVLVNGWERGIEVFPVAAAEDIGFAPIYGGGTGASLVKGWADTPASYVRYVPTSTIDRMLSPVLPAGNVLVLMDIEGAELSALKGATNLIGREPKPAWVVEICIDVHQPAGAVVNPRLVETFSIFWDAGYACYTADSLRRPVLPAEVVAIAESAHNTLPTHNFLFVDRRRPVSELLPDMHRV